MNAQLANTRVEWEKVAAKRPDEGVPAGEFLANSEKPVRPHPSPLASAKPERLRSGAAGSATPSPSGRRGSASPLQLFCWALYDWANQPFGTLINTFVF